MPKKRKNSTAHGGNAAYNQLTQLDREWEKGRVPCPLCGQKHLRPEQFKEVLQLATSLPAT